MVTKVRLEAPMFIVLETMTFYLIKFLFQIYWNILFVFFKNPDSNTRYYFTFILYEIKLEYQILCHTDNSHAFIQSNISISCSGFFSCGFCPHNLLVLPSLSFTCNISAKYNHHYHFPKEGAAGS